MSFCVSNIVFVCDLHIVAGWSSLFTRGTSGARHKIWVLFDVVHICNKHLESLVSSDAVGGRRCSHGPCIQSGHFGLKSRNFLLFGDILRSLSCTKHISRVLDIKIILLLVMIYFYETPE